MNMLHKKVVSAVGVLVLGSISTAASANTFQATELAAGYQLSAAEASCGADKVKTDGKSKEAKCGADKADKAKEGKCGEGKCGEGKCGAEKMADKAADKATDKTKEGKCGEGKCGEGKCGGMN
ncbi:HvfA family oxazolone/thioamide-modified RiPP metallophore [Rheinheimera sp.]|uniref:HvfA family oxazolone/thioamide-modified RiPP metallophore n=1 Tax=Rheinheimera sp. TaxID=1869214 RepID=UPI002FDE4E41